MPRGHAREKPFVVICDEGGRAGGILTHALHFVPALAEAGHPTTIIATREDVFSDRLKGTGVKVEHVPLTQIGRPSALYRAWSRGLKPWHGQTAVFYRSPGGSSSLAVLAALWRRFKKTFTIEQNVANVDPHRPGELISPPPRTLKRRLRNAVAARLVHRAIGCSQTVRQSLIDFYDYPPSRIVTCNNFTDTKHFHPDAEARSAFRQQHGFESDCFVVGSLGRVHKTKRIDLTIRAFDLFRRQYEDRTFLAIVGSGPHEAELKELVDQLDLQQHVRFMGWSTEAAQWHRAFDVEVLSSVYEGGSLANVEAMACGVIYIGNPVGFVDDCIEHERNGFRVVMNGPEDAAQYILKAASMSPDERQAMSRAAHQSIRDKFDRPVALAHLLEVLEAPEAARLLQSAASAEPAD